MINPLRSFAWGLSNAPYAENSNHLHPELGQVHNVFPVDAPQELAAGPRGAKAHYVATAAGVEMNGTTHYAARWLCGGNGTFITFLPGLGTRELCPRCAGKRQVANYRCFSADDRLLYIGCTGDRIGRTAFHKLYTPWWPEVARIEYEDFANPGDAWGAEAKAIAAEHPLYNVQHQAVRAA